MSTVRLGVAALVLALAAPTTTAAPTAAAAGASSSAASAAATRAATGPAERLSAAAADQRWLRRQLRGLDAVGAVAELRAPGSLVRGAAGQSLLDPGRRARPAAEFRAASVTKPMVAVLALQMVDRGEWTLDTTVGDVLPRLWPRRSEVTLRELLSHTSGMPDHLLAALAGVRRAEQLVARVSRPYRDRQLVRLGRRLPWQDLEPGQQLYSNTGYVVVGMMLRRATDLPLPQLLRRRVLRPADMERTRWPTDRRQRPPSLHEYAWWRGRLVDLGSFRPSMFSAAGAVVSTTRDLNRFHRALSDGRLLSADSLAAMRSVVVPEDEDGLGYGLGSFRLPDPCTPGGFLHGHNGASFATLTYSFGRPGGATRFTVSMTGRRFGRAPAAEQQAALAGLVVTAVGRSCGAQATERRLPAPLGDPLASLPDGPR